ncbi:hypothetical protein pb186bvf_010694 [Paramecium bursaria]
MQLDNETKLYQSIFVESAQNQTLSIPFQVDQYFVTELFRHDSFSSSLSQNYELLAIGNHQHFRVIDMITKSYQQIEIDYPAPQICTAIQIAYYNNFIAIGTQDGHLIVNNIVNSPLGYQMTQMYHLIKLTHNQIRQIHTTSGNVIIVVCLNQIKWIQHEQIQEEASKRPTRKRQKLQKNEYSMVSEGIKPLQTITEFESGTIFPNFIDHKIGIYSSCYCYETQQLIVALGDYQIIIYTLGNQMETLLSNKIIYYAEPFDMIYKIDVSEDGRLLAIAHQKFFSGDSYRIDILDLNRRGKVISQISDSGTNGIREIKLFPIQNLLFVIPANGSQFILQIDDRSKTYNLGGALQTKFLFPLSRQVYYPGFLSISEYSSLNIIQFEAPKINHLLNIPFCFYVELKLYDLFDSYKPQMPEKFGQTFYTGFTGVEKKTISAQQTVLNGETYFEPLFETVLKQVEYKKYFQTQYQEKVKYRELYVKKITQIAHWAIQKYYDKIQERRLQQELNSFPEFNPSKQMKKKNPKAKNYNPMQRIQQFASEMEQPPELNLLKHFSEDAKQKKIEQEFADETISQLRINLEILKKEQLEMKVEDEKFLLMYKLLQNMNFSNITMLLLGNCQILFDRNLPFKDHIIYQGINQMTKLTYLDLSNNGLFREDIQNITCLSGLKYIDLSSNHLGSSKKRPLIKNYKTKRGLSVNFEQSQFESDRQFYQFLFNQIPIINLKHNNFSDSEGSELLELINQKTQLLDISGNTDFGELTLKAVETFFETAEAQKNIYKESQQVVIIEFTASLSEKGMKKIANIIIEQNKVLREGQARRTSAKPQNQFIYFYVVKSTQTFYWDQSLLSLYEQQFEDQNDEISAFFTSFCTAVWVAIVAFWENIKANFLPCLYQMFCTRYILEKYLLCGYCVFLQSEYGLWITELLGIKTADYEYNDKKDELKSYLERRKHKYNILFWINFIVFYVIVIAVPIIFVNKCNGHSWYGHYIYVGYSVFIASFEIYLAQICMKFEITHKEYSTGPKWKRSLYFMKDIMLSQASKFDIYSDMCFITTVLSCENYHEIAWVSTGVVTFCLSVEAFYTLQLLCSRQGGKENYIDYLCNYCSLLEINMVSSLLEKWTIQNTTNFLCIKGLPNRVYTATFRTFIEHIPQFVLQVTYLLLTKNQAIVMLLLSLVSSTISILISITKSITITKANRINDKIMMNEVKTKLNLQREIKDPELNEKLIQFLHDYYDKFDGSTAIQTYQYGLNDTIQDYQRQQSSDQLRNVKQQQKQSYVIKGITAQEEQPLIQKQQNVDQREIDEMFETYLLLINSLQAKQIQKLWSQKLITKPLTCQILLEQEIQDFIPGINLNDEYTNHHFKEGSFIESIQIQSKILDTLIDITKGLQKDKKFRVLELGSGKGFTTQLMMKLFMEQNIDYEIVCIDHIQTLVEQANEQINIGYPEVIQEKRIKFYNMNFYDKMEMQSLGKFDLILSGFALYQQDVQFLLRILEKNQYILYPSIQYPQEHTLKLVSNMNTNPQEVMLVQSYEAGYLMPKEIQFSDLYQYYEVQRGDRCIGCMIELNGAQFYSPWLNIHLCTTCGQLDDDVQFQKYKYQSNLVFIPAKSGDKEMKRIDACKFGRNLFPSSKRFGTKQHVFDCEPCQRAVGDEIDTVNFPPYPRFICLNCRPGKFDGKHQDICYKCAQIFIHSQDKIQKLNMLEYLPGHTEEHLLLKIHYYFGYNEY